MEKIWESSIRQEAVEDTVEAISEEKVSGYYSNHQLQKSEAHKLFANGKIFIGVYAMLFPDNIKVMLHFEIIQRDFF